MPSELLLTDSANDVAAGSYSNPSLAAPFNHPNADLLSLSIGETPSSILVYLSVSELADDNTAAELRASYSFAFRFAEQDFVAYISAAPPGAEGAYRGSFCKGTWAAQETCLDGMDVAVLHNVKSYGIQIPKESLGELSAAPTQMGAQLSQWRGQSLQARPLGGDLWVGDHLNNPILDDAAFTIRFGYPQEGPLQMSSDDLYVVSNGLATSYPFVIELSNVAGQAQSVRFEASEVPQGWQVTLPDAPIDVPPSGIKEVVIVLTVPFRHGHGSIERFLLNAHDTGGELLASLDLGLIYTETPQPTGHHNVLSIHSFAGGQDGYINTLAEDPGDSQEPIRGEMEPSGTSLFNVSWNLELQPGLAMGLDFDPSRTGRLELEVLTQLPTPNMQLLGTLQVQGLDGTTILATLVPDAAVDGQAQQVTKLAATILVDSAADLVPYRDGSNLILHLTLASDLAAWSPVDLQPGGTMVLPLFDYHEDVDAALTDLSGLAWRSNLPKEVTAAPGTEVAVPLELGLVNGDARHVRVEIDSNPEGVATFVGTAEGLVSSESPLTGHVQVNVPAEAFEGQLLTIVVVAQDQAGGGALAIHRLVILVDPAAPPTQIQGDSPAEQESPLPAWLVLGALGFVLAGRRFQR